LWSDEASVTLTTLQPTALVNEVHLRLVDMRRVSWNDRAHFFAVAARSMRRILLNRGRARLSAKRGGVVHAIFGVGTVFSAVPRSGKPARTSSLPRYHFHI
jgi:ECF sigma factor